MVLEECPFCHRLLVAEQISKEEVDFNEEGMLGNPPKMIGTGRRREQARLYEPAPVSLFTSYKVTYRCKHCGEEWSKTHSEEKDIARRDAGTEQASSAEVAREEEMAEQEHYAQE